MAPKKLSELSDQELIHEAKKKKSSSITNALLIGFLIGILIYSIVKNSLGFFTLVPLFLAYKLMDNSKYNTKELDDILKERNLK
jgi:riboflavin transporter FmnP